jgi:hypothetical protein
MKLSARQAQFLLTVLGGTLNIEGSIGGYGQTTRREMYNAIVNQQSDIIVELSDEGTK